MKKLLTSISVLTFLMFFTYNIKSQIVLYGLASGGGATGDGTIFSITPLGALNVLGDLINKDTCPARPNGSLLYASDGNFYASSQLGGYDVSCTIFRCTPKGRLKIMIQLDTAWGIDDEPEGENDLIQGTDGNLYGMTTAPGSVLYKLELNGQYSVLHDFNNGYGWQPYGRLTQTEDGLLWGMTLLGGNYNNGVIFHCSTSGVYDTAYNFNNYDGTFPVGDLCLANDGNFYGLCSLGGKHDTGTLFRFNPNTNLFTKLIDFNDTIGDYPTGSVIQATDGNLYGLTSSGGKYGYGTLFRCTLAGNFDTLLSFTDSTGTNPEGSLLQASDGYLYGMTKVGGIYGQGTVFQCSLSGSFKKLADFDGTNGRNPTYGRLIEVDGFKGIEEVNGVNSEVRVFPNPNKGQFTLSNINARLNESFGQEKCGVEVYNVLGEKIYNATLSPQTPKGAFPKGMPSQNEIDISNEPNGVYFYRVVSESGELVGEGKIVVEK